MKKIFTLTFFFLTFLATGFSQSTYSVVTNRVLFSVLVNNDTLIIENTTNKVRLNGEMELFEVTYTNEEGRIVSGADPRPLTKGIDLKFWHTYPWLEERLKSDVNEIKFTDEIFVEFQGKPDPVQASFTINRLRGGQGFFSMMLIEGDFSGDVLQYDFPELRFRKDIHFKIILQIQVIN